MVSLRDIAITFPLYPSDYYLYSRNCKIDNDKILVLLIKENAHISGALVNINDGQILDTFERIETSGSPRVDMCE